jgi:hypothetical protein
VSLSGVITSGPLFTASFRRSDRRIYVVADRCGGGCHRLLDVDDQSADIPWDLVLSYGVEGLGIGLIVFDVMNTVVSPTPGVGIIGAGMVTSARAARAIPPGSFSLINWAKYPSWAPKPTGTLRVLLGTEYDAARKAANAANAPLRRADPVAYAGKQIHEIIPVKFDGSPTDIANKIAVAPPQHAELTNFWDQLMRGLP